MELDDARKLFRYEDWANREALLSIERAGGAADALRLFAHVLAARELWLSRLQARASSMPVWPALTLADCRSRLGELETAWERYFSKVDPLTLSWSVPYVNSKGEAFHRGQIATVLRAGGAEPAYTDFIHAVRSGFVTK